MDNKLTKAEAIELFGTPTKLANAVSCTRQAIYKWPDKLTQRQTDLVIGAAIRLGKHNPLPALLK